MLDKYIKNKQTKICIALCEVFIVTNIHLCSFRILYWGRNCEGGASKVLLWKKGGGHTFTNHLMFSIRKEPIVQVDRSKAFSCRSYSLFQHMHWDQTISTDASLYLHADFRECNVSQFQLVDLAYDSLLNDWIYPGLRVTQNNPIKSKHKNNFTRQDMSPRQNRVGNIVTQCYATKCYYWQNQAFTTGTVLGFECVLYGRHIYVDSSLAGVKISSVNI